MIKRKKHRQLKRRHQRNKKRKKKKRKKRRRKLRKRKMKRRRRKRKRRRKRRKKKNLWFIVREVAILMKTLIGDNLKINQDTLQAEIKLQQPKLQKKAINQKQALLRLLQHLVKHRREAQRNPSVPHPMSSMMKTSKSQNELKVSNKHQKKRQKKKKKLSNEKSSKGYRNTS